MKQMMKKQNEKNTWTWSALKSKRAFWLYSGIALGAVLGHLTNNLGTFVAVGLCTGEAMWKTYQRQVSTQHAEG
ncbi:hypothetical protein SAMN04488689_11359 [Paenibacillus sp. cl6col]|uniref:Uncharacterized protein n=4 Tax=Paenibacillus TaxID=44249 RepID=A0A383RI72_PAEAL|nr:hypothetical protein SAMN04488689_11359 [Paenibacillus sp. cl6col]SYX86660.1 conserved protein of unknown function [Paenibacillus alvei]